MDEVNTFGLTAYWRQLRENGREKMQSELINNYPFFNALRELNSAVEDDTDFVDKVKQEIFTNNIYVYSISGEIVELPFGSTVIDFAYKIHTDVGNHLHKAFINGKEVKLTRTLNNKDRIAILQSEKAKPRESWLNHVATLNAKRKIKDFLKNK
jgi:GTP pyrophosphokinase